MGLLRVVIVLVAQPTGGVPVTTLTVALDRQAERIGKRIRELRRARGLTLVQLAADSELSHPFLSQLERGLARPSMVSLEKIARALGTSQLELIAAAEDASSVQAPAATVVRAGEGTRGHYAEGEARMLVQGIRRFHPMEFTGDNESFGDYFAHEEDEFLTVIDGAVEVDLGPEGSVVLEPGDSVYYGGGTPHRWRAARAGGFRLFVVKERPRKL